MAASPRHGSAHRSSTGAPPTTGSIPSSTVPHPDPLAATRPARSDRLAATRSPGRGARGPPHPPRSSSRRSATARSMPCVVCCPRRPHLPLRTPVGLGPLPRGPAGRPSPTRTPRRRCAARSPTHRRRQRVGHPDPDRPVSGPSRSPLSPTRPPRPRRAPPTPSCVRSVTSSLASRLRRARAAPLPAHAPVPANSVDGSGPRRPNPLPRPTWHRSRSALRSPSPRHRRARPEARPPIPAPRPGPRVRGPGPVPIASPPSDARSNSTTSTRPMRHRPPHDPRRASPVPIPTSPVPIPTVRNDVRRRPHRPRPRPPSEDAARHDHRAPPLNRDDRRPRPSRDADRHRPHRVPGPGRTRRAPTPTSRRCDHSACCDVTTAPACDLSLTADRPPADRSLVSPPSCSPTTSWWRPAHRRSSLAPRSATAPP